MEFSEKHFPKDKKWPASLKDDPERLMAYLEKAYRANLWVELPALVNKMEALCRDKSLFYPHLQEALLHLKLVHTTLLHHMLSEEAVLFVLLQKPGEEKKLRPGGKDALRELVGLLEQEHTIVEEGLLRVRDLCQGYRLSLNDGLLPELYARLEKCENLIMEQIFLENKFLFEKIIQKIEALPGSS